MAQEKIGTRYDYEALRVILENKQGRHLVRICYGP